MKRVKKSKNGFSLIELLLVLGVVAVLAVTAFIVYSKMQDNMAVEEYSYIINEILMSEEEWSRAAFQDKTGTMMPYVTQMSDLKGFLSPEFERKYLDENGTIKLKQGMMYPTIMQSYSENGSTDYFGVSMMVPSKSQCIKLLSKYRGTHVISLNMEVKSQMPMKDITNGCIENAMVIIGYNVANAAG